MKKQNFNKLEFITGFVMGVIFGIGLEFIILFFYNLLCFWEKCQFTQVSWWMAVPFPLFIGFKMAVAIASLHLEDY